MKLLQLSRSDRLLLGILLPLALLGALIGWLAMPPKKEGSWIRQPSTFFNTGSGAKAAYLVLERLGYQVSQLRQPIARNTLDGFDALVVLEPIIGLEKDERTALSGWVAKGHYLVVAPGVRSFGGGMLGTWLFDNWFNVGPPSAPIMESDGQVHALAGDSLNLNDPLIAGVREMVGRADFRFPSGSVLKGPLVGSPVDEIWKDDYGVVAIRVHYGEGTIIALADSYWLSNKGLDEADNSFFLANLAREITGGSGKGSIGFDEIHHGFAITGDPRVAMMKTMLAEHWGWGIVQAALVCVLALYAGAIRFGRPRDIVQQPRRQHGEFAEAAGRTLHDARESDLAYRTLYQHYRGRLAKLLHLPHTVPSRELAQAVAAQCGLNILGILQEADEKVRFGRATRVQVLDVATQLHQVLDKLEHAA